MLLVDADAVTMIATALAMGAAAGLTDTAGAAVKDAYVGLKRLITERYHDVDVTPVEQRPHSLAKCDSVAEDLANAGAGEDVELLAAARQVIEAVYAHSPGIGSALGVDLERIRAEAVRIHDVAAEGTGVRGRDWQVGGDVTISGVRSGNQATPPGP
jgi:hypothetical protein